MPFKRKIATPEAPKRSFRNGRSGKRKLSKISTAKAKKPRSLQ